MSLVITEPVMQHIIRTMEAKVEADTEFMDFMLDDLDGGSPTELIQDVIDGLKELILHHQALDSLYKALPTFIEEYHGEGTVLQRSRARYHEGQFADWLDEARNMKAVQLGLTLEGDE